MSSGSLTLGGNLSVAVGPIGRNAEGSGAVNSKGKVAAIYSYSKTKGLFGGISVEGSVIVERQDANRMAYGGSISVKQILSGAIGSPIWASDLVDEIEKCTSHSRRHRLQPHDNDREEEDMGRNNTRSSRGTTGSAAGGYAFGDGIESQPPHSSAPEGRGRAGSLLGGGDKTKEGDSPSRPSAFKRVSSATLNPFGSRDSNSHQRTNALPSSESYNAGLTWDSDGPMNGYAGRSRSGSNALRTNGLDSSLTIEDTPGFTSRRSIKADNNDLLQDYGTPRDGSRTGSPNSRARERDLLGTWGADANGLSASFAQMSTDRSSNSRSRGGSKPAQPFDDIFEDDSAPHEAVSTFASQQIASDATSGRREPSGTAPYSPFGEDEPDRGQLNDYLPRTSQPSQSSIRKPPSLPPRRPEPVEARSQGGYAKAVALFDFDAAQLDDLGLRKGDTVLVLESVGKGNWWKGRKGVGGAEGIFPRDYVEVVEIPKALKTLATRTELKKRVIADDFD